MPNKSKSKTLIQTRSATPAEEAEVTDILAKLGDNPTEATVQNALNRLKPGRVKKRLKYLIAEANCSLEDLRAGRRAAIARFLVEDQPETVESGIRLAQAEERITSGGSTPPEPTDPAQRARLDQIAKAAGPADAEEPQEDSLMPQTEDPS